MSVDQPSKIFINANDCNETSQGIYSFTLPTAVYNAKSIIVESTTIVQSQFTLSPNQRNIQFFISGGPPAGYNLTLQGRYYSDISAMVINLNNLINSSGPFPGQLNFSFDPVTARVSATSNTIVTVTGWTNTNKSILRRLGFVGNINLNNNTVTATGIPQLLPTLFYDLQVVPLFADTRNLCGGNITSSTAYRITNNANATPGALITDDQELDRVALLPAFSQYNEFSFYFTDDEGNIIDFPPLSNHSIVLAFQYT